MTLSTVTPNFVKVSTRSMASTFRVLGQRSPGNESMSIMCTRGGHLLAKLHIQVPFSGVLKLLLVMPATNVTSSTLSQL